VIRKQLQVTNEASTVGDQWSLRIISYIRSKHNLVFRTGKQLWMLGTQEPSGFSWWQCSGQQLCN